MNFLRADLHIYVPMQMQAATNQSVLPKVNKWGYIPNQKNEDSMCTTPARYSDSHITPVSPLSAVHTGER